MIFNIIRMGGDEATLRTVALTMDYVRVVRQLLQAGDVTRTEAAKLLKVPSSAVRCSNL
jgi:hypothetical protein